MPETDKENQHGGAGWRQGLASWLKWLLFLGTLACALSARAQGVPYEVQIDAPREIRQMLNDNLDLIRLRGNVRMDAAQLERLYRGTPDEIRQLAQTEGYYTPEIESHMETSEGTTRMRFRVEPGEPVRVGSIELVFEGAIATQPAKERPRPEQLRNDWKLKQGAVFRHADWEAAKTALLRGVTQLRYPRAQLTETQATVDPVARKAALRVVVNSGDPVRFGPIRIEGLERYPESVVLRESRIRQGDIYRERALRAFQTRLQDSGYFRNVEVSPDLESGTDEVPVRVTVSEYQRRRIGLGVGFSTNTGARTRLSYDDLTFLGRELKLNSSITMETKRQAASANILLPGEPRGYRDSVGAMYERTDIEGEDLRVASANARRTWGSPRTERSLTLEYINERRSVAGGDVTYSQALPLTYGTIWRRLDNRLNPTRGYTVQAQIGAAVEPLLTDKSFVRAYTKGVRYQPFGRDVLILRGELGAVMSNGKEGIPSTLMFRAGGDQSVRGYAYQSLGVREDRAIVGGRYVATGTVEYQYWFLPSWGAAAFVDAGNAGDSLSALDPAFGYGVGARWRSPVGPVSLDVAYGERTREYRVHFSLGFTF